MYACHVAVLRTTLSSIYVPPPDRSLGLFGLSEFRMAPTLGVTVSEAALLAARLSGAIFRPKLGWTACPVDLVGPRQVCLKGCWRARFKGKDTTEPGLAQCLLQACLLVVTFKGGWSCSCLSNFCPHKAIRFLCEPPGF